jgi:hypothetical protein
MQLEWTCSGIDMLTFSTDFLVSILIVGKIFASIFSSNIDEIYKNNRICIGHILLQFLFFM